ncbi:MAG: TlpA family protein disulfide reductase [Alphaproteobacteria bacterium]
MRVNGFVLGLICSPVILLIYWWLAAQPEPESPDAESALTLFDINYIPTVPPKAVSDVPFQGADKQAVNLKQSLGKPVILHFWAPWCGICLVGMPDMEAFAKKHGKDVNIICVANDHTGGQSSKDYYQSNDFQHLSLNIDQHEGQSGSLGGVFRVRGFPTTVFISAKGEEIGRIIGPVEWQGAAGELLLKLLKE